MSSSTSTSAYVDGIPASNISFSSANTFQACQGGSEADVAAIVYLYTSAVPASVHLAESLIKDPRLNEVIQTICVDNATVRNYLIFGTTPVTRVPAFVVKLGDTITIYKGNDASKVIALATEAAESASTTARETGGAAAAAQTARSSAAARLSAASTTFTLA